MVVDVAEHEIERPKKQKSCYSRLSVLVVKKEEYISNEVQESELTLMAEAHLKLLVRMELLGFWRSL